MMKHHSQVLCPGTGVTVVVTHLPHCWHTRVTPSVFSSGGGPMVGAIVSSFSFAKVSSVTCVWELNFEFSAVFDCPITWDCGITQWRRMVQIQNDNVLFACRPVYFYI